MHLTEQLAESDLTSKTPRVKYSACMQIHGNNESRFHPQKWTGGGGGGGGGGGFGMPHFPSNSLNSNNRKYISF